MAKSGSMIDFKNLPNEAIDELYRFYEYLIHKYKRRKKKVHKENILNNVEKMSWDIVFVLVYGFFLTTIVCSWFTNI